MKPCRKCGATDRNASGKCKACDAVYGATYRASHKEERAVRGAVHYVSRKEEMAADYAARKGGGRYRPTTPPAALTAKTSACVSSAVNHRGRGALVAQFALLKLTSSVLSVFEPI